MHFTYCTLPLARLPNAITAASNEAQLGCLESTPTLQQAHIHQGNVRLMRRTKDMDNTCFALSGKLADVCAALDALAAQETRNAWRVATH